jgi:membrane protein YqaA with SNARE-associated domain
MLAMPVLGLGAIFLISLLAATLLPLGSEPALLGYLALQPHMFWPALLVATLGNALGGVITFWMGASAHRAYCRLRAQAQTEPSAQIAQAHLAEQGRWVRHATSLTQRFGPFILLLSWVPLLGDPLCAVAGWLRLPFWASVFFMTVGKFARYAAVCGLLLPLSPAI